MIYRAFSILAFILRIRIIADGASSSARDRQANAATLSVHVPITREGGCDNPRRGGEKENHLPIETKGVAEG